MLFDTPLPSVNGEVLGIYVTAGDRNLRWSLLIGWFALRTYLDSGLMAMCFVAVVFPFFVLL